MTRVSGPRSALAGALSAAAGLVVAEVLALVLPSSPSVVLAIADRVISDTPDGVRESLIGAVGTADKPLLAAGIVLTVLAIGAVAGAMYQARPHLVRWLAAGVGVLGVALAAGLSATTAWLSFTLPAAVGVAVTLGVLHLLIPGATAVADAATVIALDRRGFLLRAGAVGVGLAVGGSVLAASRRGAVAAVDAVRRSVGLPAVARPLPPVPSGATPAVAGLPPFITPAGDFYLIDTALIKPAVDPATWRLSIGGRVKTPITLSYDDLMAMPQVQINATLTCVSNSVGGDLVGNAVWQGVPLPALLDKVGVNPDAVFVTSESVDGFTAAFPVDLALDGRDAIVAVGMNGAPLPVDHGFPARLVVPGLYGYVSATKWLKEIRLTADGDEEPFWVQRGWLADGTIAASSRIDVPRGSGGLAAGPIVVAGRAWHQHVGVAEVQVSVDEGVWQSASLAQDVGVDSWRLWSWTWQADSGSHDLRVRMRGADGVWQDEVDRPVFPGASSGLHSVRLTVA